MDGQHHLNIRKRLFEKMQAYPHPKAFARALDRVMYVVSIGVPLALVPQVVQVYATKDVSDLALPTWCLLAFFNILWTLYGIVHKEKPIIISSAATALLQLSLVYAIFAFN